MTVQRTDYQPYPYSLSQVDLTFDLEPSHTTVVCQFQAEYKNPSDTIKQSLTLDGDELNLTALRVDGIDWLDYTFNDDRSLLQIHNLPTQCQIEIHNSLNPSENHALMGLYASGQNLLTQCEAQGMRRICWFADRPDVMATYRVTLKACQTRYPTLLSNGNLIKEASLESGRHLCVWEDPFPKPSYLFALVAGRFDCREQSLKIKSGRDVLLQIYSDPGTLDRTEWAMESLIRSIRWDESRFNLELDLDRFMIVAVSDFNMGAMENKGLNVFNDAYVLANPRTATDTNYRNIEAVIGHEYFHNWTGNRVTCRDWFQLSLKEGLTVFRDQEFTADMLAQGLDAQRAASARAIKRIDDVTVLRNSQFPEDSGPMAHPVRPQSYEEISNFYTATIYEKGAELIRMLHTLLGETTFQVGTQLYFERHDGQAVTCEDWVNALEDAWKLQDSSRSLRQFMRWYDQAGTPTVHVTIESTDQTNQVRITLTQSNPPVGIERTASLEKPPLHIPFAIGAIEPDGQALTLRCEGQTDTTILLELTQTTQSWLIDDWTQNALPSLLRDFSAPVRIEYCYDDRTLHHLARHDANAFARWQAMQDLLSRTILNSLTNPQASETEHASLVETLSAVLQDDQIDEGYRARLLQLPKDAYLLQLMDEIDPVGVAQAKIDLIKQLGTALAPQLLKLITDLQPQPGQPFDPGAVAAGRRDMYNLALSWLCSAAHPEALSLTQTQYTQADNMTLQFGALQALFLHPTAKAQAKQHADAFYAQFQDDPLVIDKWFALQATAPGTTVNDIRTLMQHPAYNARNPNRIRALVFQFCINNPLGFHSQDGSGYAFWTEQVCTLDKDNPEIAARFARLMDHWRGHTPKVAQAMQAALEKVNIHPKLSPNTREIVQKALEL
ncbi:aminopeptidase N [Orrella sp. 11846]|uniref:aminopeptidase N n=1 Tax=Orrella sp. 11846 TaxID=3409913 RepID=UPI003B59234E